MTDQRPSPESVAQARALYEAWEEDRGCPVPHGGRCGDECQIQRIALALARAYRDGELAEAAKHGDCCVDREELDSAVRAAYQDGERAAWEAVQDNLRAFLLTPHSFDRGETPLNDYGKRIIRVLLEHFVRAAIPAPDEEKR